MSRSGHTETASTGRAKGGVRARTLALLLASGVLGGSHASAQEPLKLIVIDPAHFHAALVQKQIQPRISPKVLVYAPLGPEILDYLKRIELYNSRQTNPTAWEVTLYTGKDFEKAAWTNRPPGIVVLSGRNPKKAQRIAEAVRAGFHVLADKPWTLKSSELPVIEAALDEAARKGLVVYDIMTERYDATMLVARALLSDPAVIGRLLPGTPEDPSAVMRSSHAIQKIVSGVPLQRPVGFFDINEQGEGLSDVGTHLVDLMEWSLFPDQAIDYMSDIRLLGTRRWPTEVSLAAYERVTGTKGFAKRLSPWVTGDKLAYYGNNSVTYVLRGIHVKLDILWSLTAGSGPGDSFEATFRGTNSRLELRQAKDGNYQTELYVLPEPGASHSGLSAALRSRVAQVASTMPGLAVEEKGGEFHIAIPAPVRVGHEEHFGQVLRQFLAYIDAPGAMPKWERPNQLAKYWLTTRGVELSHK